MLFEDVDIKERALLSIVFFFNQGTGDLSINGMTFEDLGRKDSRTLETIFLGLFRSLHFVWR